MTKEIRYGKKQIFIKIAPRKKATKVLRKSYEMSNNSKENAKNRNHMLEITFSTLGNK